MESVNADDDSKPNRTVSLAFGTPGLLSFDTPSSLWDRNSNEAGQRMYN